MTHHGLREAALFNTFFLIFFPALSIPFTQTEYSIDIQKRDSEPVLAFDSESLFIVLYDAADFGRVLSQKLVEHSNDDPGPGGNADQPGKRMNKACPALHLFDFLFLDQFFHLA